MGQFDLGQDQSELSKKPTHFHFTSLARRSQDRGNLWTQNLWRFEEPSKPRKIFCFQKLSDKSGTRFREFGKN